MRKAWHGAIHQSRVSLGEVFVAQAKRSKFTRSKILDQKVCGIDQLQGDMSVGFAFQVQHHTFFTTIKNRTSCGRVPRSAWGVNPDNFGTLLRQKHGGQRARHVLPEIKNAKSR
jgi:hypothetical protein